VDHERPLFDDAYEATFDVDALVTQMAAQSAWAAAQAARVAGAIEMRAAIEARVLASWLDREGTLFDVRFAAFAPRGPDIDDAALEATLGASYDDLDEVLLAHDGVTARASRVSRAALLPLVDRLLDTWRVVVRHRAGADVDDAS